MRRKAVLVLLGSTAILLFNAPTALAQESSSPILDPSTTRGFWLLVLLVVAVVVAWALPFIIDLRAAYRKQTQSIIRMVGDPDTPNKLTAEELKDVLKVVGESPSGTKGLTRGLLALTVLTAVSLALMLTLSSSSPDASDLRKTIITGLVSILGTIIGFYFGSRTATEAQEAGAEAAARGAAGTGGAETGGAGGAATGGAGTGGAGGAGSGGPGGPGG